MQELCQKYGVEIQSLPPFRPDGKGLVEKSFDLIQQRYKPLLRGKGVIEPDAQERWSVDYRSQSVLTLDEFTKIVIHCVLYINSGRILADAKTPAQKWLDSGVSLLDVPVEELYLMSLPRDTAKLTRKGLRVNGLLYVPTDMDALTLEKTYDVAYSRSDLSCIYVLLDNCSFKMCFLSPHQSQYSCLSQPETSALNPVIARAPGKRSPGDFASQIPESRPPNGVPDGSPLQSAASMDLWTKTAEFMLRNELGHIHPSPHHYMLRMEVPLGITAKEFFAETQKEYLENILPQQVQVETGEIIEIDDGFRPYCFYVDNLNCAPSSRQRNKMQNFQATLYWA